MTIGISIVASAITAVVVTKVLATHHFKIVDSYVEDMCDMTKKSNEDTLTALRKLERCFPPKECGEDTGKDICGKR